MTHTIFPKPVLGSRPTTDEQIWTEIMSSGANSQDDPEFIASAPVPGGALEDQGLNRDTAPLDVTEQGGEAEVSSSYPNGKTGRSLRHSPTTSQENLSKSVFYSDTPPLILPDPPCETELKSLLSASNHPSLSDSGQKQRRSRARETSPEMTAFLSKWFFDFLAVTIPNTVDGKGIRRRAEKDRPNASEDLAGQEEARAATDMMCRWAVSQGLRKIRLTKGTDGYRAGINYGRTPVDKDRLATIRDGHVSNMPGLEIPGGDGSCATLAPSALSLLGPVNAARIDVSWDHSRPGYWDELFAYAEANSTSNHRPVITDRGAGRTFTWSRGDVKLKVYEKDKERLARGKIAPNDVDENLVRVEFGFHPTRPADKAAYARLAREHGPGALLGSVHWVRRMLEHIATLTGQLDPDAAQIGMVRLDRLPISATVEDRARHGLEVYAKTFCNAAMARIVDAEFGGDWLAASVEPDRVRDGVIAMVGDWIEATRAHLWAVSAAGVDQARTINEEAARNGEALRNWLERQAWEVEVTQKELALAHNQAIRLDDRRDEFEAAVAEAACAAAAEVRADLADWVREQTKAQERAAATAEARLNKKVATLEAAEAAAQARAHQTEHALRISEFEATARINERADRERRKIRAGYKRAKARLDEVSHDLAVRAERLGV